MLFRPNPSSGIPIYLQLIQQVRHGVEVGLLSPGDQLPGIRRAAEDLVINPNTVAKAYRELEHLGLVELRHGAGAFISAAASESARTDRLRAAAALVDDMVRELHAQGVEADEIRRLFDAALAQKGFAHGR